MRILVVEDDPVQASIAARILEARGFEVVAASGVAQALRELTASPFDAAVVDVFLEDGDGFELAERLVGDHPALRCWLVTGHELPDGAARAARLGARFSTKPLDFALLASDLRR